MGDIAYLLGYITALLFFLVWWILILFITWVLVKRVINHIPEWADQIDEIKRLLKGKD